MKQIIDFSPVFDPVNKTLDFSAMVPAFEIKKLYAVINETRGQIIYAMGTTCYAHTSEVGGLVTLHYNTTHYSADDVLSVIYDLKMDFNAGATGAQTLRTAANIYGKVRGITPNPSADEALLQLAIDERARAAIVPPSMMHTLWGINFSASTGRLALTGTTETPLALFRNPNGSGKIVRFQKIYFGPTLGNNYCEYKLYINPTITANGTTVTPVGGRQTGQAAAIALVTHTPTISANGSLFKSIVASGLSGQTVPLDLDFNLFLDPNNSLLVTRTLSSNATIGGTNFEWAET